MNLLLGILLFILGQTLIWFQTNGQFIWPWFKENPLILSVVGGTVISYLFIKGTYFLATHFEGLLWPGRFIGFSIGIFVFGICTYAFLNEGLNMKTIVSLVLSTAVVLIQIFWK